MTTIQTKKPQKFSPNKPQQMGPPTQHKLDPIVFDAYNKESPIQSALGSDRVQSVKEVGALQSTNFVSGVSGWRLTNDGLEFGNTSGIFPPGTITFTDIQNISTGKLLGRSTAGSGSIEQISIGTGLSLSGGSLSSTITQYTDEMAQDAVGGALTDSTTVDFTYNDGANTITAAVISQMSIIADASGLKLSGDAATPGNNKYYGTDGSGNKGWYSSVIQTVTPVISTGTAAPATTPGKVGDLYVDTNNKKLYVATGTINSADWTITN